MNDVGSTDETVDPWVPDDFEHPLRLDLPTGHHLRPVRGDDAPLDFAAVTASRDRLWSIYGESWGWPTADLTVEESRAHLERHERGIKARESYQYAVFDEDETALLGCVYIDPPRHGELFDAVISWWVVEGEVGGRLEQAVDDAIPGWLAEEWGFERPFYGVV